MRRTAAAQDVKQVKHHGYAGLTAGHRIRIRRFVGYLWPGLITDTDGAWDDDGPEPCHCRAGREPTKTQLRDGRRDHAVEKFLLQGLKHMAVRTETQKRAVDQVHTLIGGHDLV